ncbi:MAG: hypothetical protein ACK6D1_10850, partial [Planctomycetota bacterium]
MRAPLPRFLPVFLLGLAVATAQDESPWRTQLRQLPAQAAPAEPPAQAALLLPELAFKPARRWLFFAEMAKELATDDVTPE